MCTGRACTTSKRGVSNMGEGAGTCKRFGGCELKGAAPTHAVTGTWQRLKTDLDQKWPGRAERAGLVACGGRGGWGHPT